MSACLSIILNRGKRRAVEIPRWVNLEEGEYGFFKLISFFET